MRKLSYLRTAALTMLPLLVPSLHAVISRPVTIIDYTVGGVSGVRTHLTNSLAAAGIGPVTLSLDAVPASLAGQRQVWDLRFNNTVLSPAEIATYTAYLQGGGSLFLMGENTGFNVRNNSLLSFIATLGGGSLTMTTPQNLQTVAAPFNGPTSLPTVNLRAAGGVATTGRGYRVTYDANNIAGAIGFGPAALTNAPAGALIVVFDVNFMDSDANAGELGLMGNLISYLGAPSALPIPTPAPNPSETPLPPSAILAFTGLAGAGAMAWRRTRAR